MGRLQPLRFRRSAALAWPPRTLEIVEQVARWRPPVIMNRLPCTLRVYNWTSSSTVCGNPCPRTCSCANQILMSTAPAAVLAHARTAAGSPTTVGAFFASLKGLAKKSRLSSGTKPAAKSLAKLLLIGVLFQGTVNAANLLLNFC